MLTALKKTRAPYTSVGCLHVKGEHSNCKYINKSYYGTADKEWYHVFRWILRLKHLSAKYCFIKLLLQISPNYTDSLRRLNITKILVL